MERVGALLESLEGADLLRHRLAEARAMESWPGIVGSPLAQRTRPLRLAGHRLFVLCHGAALRQELTFHKREILRKFNRAAGVRGAARELMLLESDADLSSLVRDVEGEEWRRRMSEDVVARAERGEDVKEEEPQSGDARIAAAYPRFDGDAYRREMARIGTRAARTTSPDQEPERES